MRFRINHLCKTATMLVISESMHYFPLAPIKKFSFCFFKIFISTYKQILLIPLLVFNTISLPSLLNINIYQYVKHQKQQVFLKAKLSFFIYIFNCEFILFFFCFFLQINQLYRKDAFL